MSKHGKRYITVLPPIVLLNMDGSRARDPKTNELVPEVTFRDFILGRVQDPAFVSETPMEPQTVHWSMPMIEARVDIRMAVKDLKPGDVLELDEEEWHLLKRAVEKGQYGLGGDSCVEFMRAVIHAPMADPRRKKATEPEGDADKAPS